MEIFEYSRVSQKHLVFANLLLALRGRTRQLPGSGNAEPADGSGPVGWPMVEQAKSDQTTASHLFGKVFILLSIILQKHLDS